MSVLVKKACSVRTNCNTYGQIIQSQHSAWMAHLAVNARMYVGDYYHPCRLLCVWKDQHYKLSTITISTCCIIIRNYN